MKYHETVLIAPIVEIGIDLYFTVRDDGASESAGKLL